MGHVEVMQLLLSQPGIDIDKSDYVSAHPLHLGHDSCHEAA